MSNQNDTQTLLIKLSNDVAKLSSTFESALVRIDKIVSAHSDELWGTDDENIGMKTKLRDITEERKREKENRLWWRGAIGIPVIGLTLDWILKVLHILKN